jgi:hypothetical protein
MKFLSLIFTLLIAMIAASPTYASVDDGTVISEQQMAPLAEWIAHQTGVTIEVLPAAIASDRKLEKALRLEDAQHAGAAGAYIPGRIILSNQIWDPSSPQAQSYLLHELVHHAQFLSGRNYPCHAAEEREAYTLQSKWLVEHGIKPLVTAAWIDKMSSCSQSATENN